MAPKVLPLDNGKAGKVCQEEGGRTDHIISNVTLNWCKYLVIVAPKMHFR